MPGCREGGRGGDASVLWQSCITGNKLFFVHKSAQVQVLHPATVTKVIFKSASEPEPLAGCLSTALLASPCSAEDFLPHPACFAVANPLNLANLSSPTPV